MFECVGGQQQWNTFQGMQARDLHPGLLCCLKERGRQEGPWPAGGWVACLLDWPCISGLSAVSRPCSHRTKKLVSATTGFFFFFFCLAKPHVSSEEGAWKDNSQDRVWWWVVCAVV